MYGLVFPRKVQQTFAFSKEIWIVWCIRTSSLVSCCLLSTESTPRVIVSCKITTQNTRVDRLWLGLERMESTGGQLQGRRKKNRDAHFLFNPRHIIRPLKLSLEKTRVQYDVSFCIHLGWSKCWSYMGLISLRVFFSSTSISPDFFVLSKRIDLAHWYSCLWKMWRHVFRLFWMFLNNLKVVIGKFVSKLFQDFYYRKTLKIVLVSGFLFF